MAHRELIRAINTEVQDMIEAADTLDKEEDPDVDLKTSAKDEAQANYDQAIQNIQDAIADYEDDGELNDSTTSS